MKQNTQKTDEQKIKELINKKLDQAQALIAEAKKLAQKINLLPKDR
jgi:hypothetical protein